MRLLIVALDPTRWGPARLPAPLREAGFKVAALCPADNPLAHTEFIDQRFEVADTRSFPRFASALLRAMEAFQPALVVPADEMVVVLLHDLLRRHAGGWDAWPAEFAATIESSLCPPRRRDAMLFKNDCQALAREIGVRTPAGEIVRAPDEARAAAGRLGYPVILKQSFGWGGMGVRKCETPESLLHAFERMRPRETTQSRRIARQIAGRDWYPEPRDLQAQQAIDGHPAMYTFVAAQGRMLAGFAGVPRATSGDTGPSTVVDFGPHEGMEMASRRMAQALGCTGFVSFDFMIARETGEAFLLECNARPNQVSHLGARVGVDLCAALHEGLRDAAVRRPLAPSRAETVALFPQEWLRQADSPALRAFHHDVPWNDESLLARCLAAAPETHPSFLRTLVSPERLAGSVASAA